MNTLIKSIEAEFLRYKALAESALVQVPDALLSEPGPGGGNSLVTICWHIAGNLRSRFTDFRTSDGEKPWRNREEEFLARSVSRSELLAQWSRGWDALLSTLSGLSDGDLEATVRLRGQALAAHEALHRSLAHVSYHVGQIVYVAHVHCGSSWRYLSIPPGSSAAYNAGPVNEKPLSHAAYLREHVRSADDSERGS